MRGIPGETENHGVANEIAKLIDDLSRVLTRDGRTATVTVPAHTHRIATGRIDEDHWVELSLPAEIKWAPISDGYSDPLGTSSAVQQLRAALQELDPNNAWTDPWDSVPVVKLKEE